MFNCKAKVNLADFMDMILLKKGLEYTKRNRKRVLILGALGVGGYGAYKVYNSPSVVKKRQKLLKILGAFVSVAAMVSDSAETIGIVSKDLKEFMGSDSNEIPQSLKQVSKIARSNEFSESLTRITRGLTVGILRGYQLEVTRNGGSLGEKSGFIDRVMDKMFSEAGSGFASVVVGSLARNLVMAFYSNYNLEDSTDGNKNVQRWIELACEDKCRELIGDWIRLLVSTAVTVYLDKTMNINTYDELVSGLTNPKHEARAKDMLVSVCNGGIETLVRTSHQLWTANSIATSNLNSFKELEFEEDFSDNEKTSDFYKPKKLVDNNGWIGKVSSTLAVPSNRKLILDTTGMVTFETIRYFLELLLEKLSEHVRRSVDVVNQEVVDRGVEAMRYMSGKSSTVASVCISLCLHILNSPWVLAPAY